MPGYRDVAELGRGSQGRVVVAVRDGGQERVAIKYLTEQVLSQDGFRVRFRREARLLAGVADPHVVRLLDYVESPAGAAIVMEYIDGFSLAELLRKYGPTGPQAALVVLEGSLLGLAAAHRLGVVHRDYKPANVLVDRLGVSKLTDFGIALGQGEFAGASGTPSYMPPEQWRGGPAAPEGDVYAATAVFYECLTGRPPYSGTMTELAFAHGHAPIPVNEVPERLRGLLAAGLAKDPAERPASAEALLADLRAVAADAYGPTWREVGTAALAAGAAAAVAVGVATTGVAGSGAASVVHSGRLLLLGRRSARAIRAHKVVSITVAATTIGATTYLLTRGGGSDPAALSLGQARTVLSEYVSTVRRADAALDSTLLSKVEAGTALDVASAYYGFARQYRVTSPAPLAVQQPDFWIPRVRRGSPRWFVVQAGPGSFSNPAQGGFTAYDDPASVKPWGGGQLLFARQDDGRWKAVMLTRPPDDPVLLLSGGVQRRHPAPAAPLLHPTLDRQGYASEVSMTAPGYAARPDTVAELAQKIWQSGDADAAARFADGGCAPVSPSAQTRRPPADWTERYVFSAGPTQYALKVGDNLIEWFTLKVTHTSLHNRVNTGTSFSGMLPPFAGASQKGYVVTHSRTQTSLQVIQYAIVIPPPGRKLQAPTCEAAPLSVSGT